MFCEKAKSAYIVKGYKATNMNRSVILLLSVVVFLAACSMENSEKPLQYKAEVFNGKWLAGEYVAAANRFFLVGEQGSVGYSADGKNWQSGDTPVMYTLHGVASNHSQKTLVAVGEAGTILRSTNSGESWELRKISSATPVQMKDTRLNKVIYIEKTKSWVAVGTQNAIVYSGDDGLSWQLVSFNTAEDQLEIIGLSIEKQSGDVLFAGQYGTTGRSNDGGLDWDIVKHDMEPVGSYIPHVVGFHQFENVLIAAADHGRLLISKDTGLSWDLKKLPTGGYFTDSAFDPVNQIIALTTQMGEVVISKDGGDSWQLITFEVANWPSDDIPYLSKIKYDVPTKSMVLLGNSGVLARSNDGGQTWFADIFKPFFNMSITTMLHNPEKNIYVAAGLGGVVGISQGLGFSALPIDGWEVVRPGIDQYIREVKNLPGTNIFVAVGQLGGLWRSSDDGKSWKMIDVDFPLKNQPPHLRDIVQDSETGALLAVGPVGTILRSTDQGLTWTSVFQGKAHLGEAFTQILYDEKNKSYLLCEVLYRSVYQSADAGQSWSKVTTIESNERNLWHGAVSDKLDLVMVLGQKGGIATSFDGGVSWKMAETNTYNDLYGAYADEKTKLLLAVGQHGMVLRSENGSAWEIVESGTAATLRRVVKDPNSGALIAFGQGGVIVRSTDEGKSWALAERPVYEGELRTLVIENKTNNLLLVGREGAILRSVDGGISWQMISSHTTQHFRSAAVNPATGTVIVVGQSLVRLGVRN